MFTALSGLCYWQTAELLPCLCVWILTSVDNKTAEEATSHLAEAPQHHEWTLHDLSIIWKTLLWRGHFRILLRGFELFQQVMVCLIVPMFIMVFILLNENLYCCKYQWFCLFLFSQDCPLVLVLRMFELCCDYRNFTEAKTKLMDFQRTLIAVSLNWSLHFNNRKPKCSALNMIRLGYRNFEPDY